ncbi:MAG: transcription-repair coupling factor [Lachnospiraceae bacterium]|nr:transcription-repair coupling factor [Lachnospiraceae bacterium]
MKILNAPLKELSWFEEAAFDVEEGKAKLSITGTVDSEKLHMISALGERTDVSVIITYSDVNAAAIAEEYRFFDRNTYVYPAKDLIFYQADINGAETLKKRLSVIKQLLTGGHVTVVTTFDALMEPCLPLDVIKDHILYVEKGRIIEEDAAAIMLVSMGYTRTSYQVASPGEFSIRGGIIDVFDVTAENPLRIELWGDEVESIRYFDAESQRSIEEIDKAEIFPAAEMILGKTLRYEGYRKIETEMKARIEEFRDAYKPEEASRLKMRLEELENVLIHDTGVLNLDGYIHYFYPETVNFLDLLKGRRYCVFLDEPARLSEYASGVEIEYNESMKNRLAGGYCLPGQADILTPVNAVLHRLNNESTVQLMGLPREDILFPGERKESLNVRTLSSYNSSFSALTADLKKLKDEGYRVVILSGSRARAKRLAEDLGYEDIIAAYTENADDELVPKEIVTFYGRVRKGFTYPDLKFTVIAETDIFGAEHRKKKKKKSRFAPGRKLEGLSDLHVGDYVINEDCGVGIYRGIEKVEIEHIRKDYMKIEYRDGAFLYVPATAFDKVSLYADKDAKKPKLNKLGTEEWNRTKEKAKTAVDTVAKELVDLYAARMMSNGYRYGEDTVWQREFEEMFPYEETDDQLNAIEATKADMESSKIMDRLICGDVGFGKTEIAIRAAFKAVQENKQVAYLVPTTILAEQHFNTFTERMKNYPVRIEMLSRFRTPAQIKKALANLKAGLVDIVIGTHRLLSKDVQFSDLGLLIIDEEQRFGVGHKEKIKQLKQNVDVLTLTATPIPRTLHMSLAGIRDMSLLEEAPQNRQPIQTFICEYNEEMVREAVKRELMRGGQVYYVYNRIANIAEIADEVSALVPGAKVAFAHGQMSENMLEDIMMSFINREIDVLVSTTIIETGLDIPNVNTMIIRDSDRMGLAQLYQLRGRVGRSERTAYAFLMYDRNKILKETAEKRLSAIREYTELGSGFKIAMSDLEIRGAGNVLGKAQHGQVEAIGYDLYCRMLEAAIKEKRGLPPERDEGCEMDMNIDAFLPPSYIVNELQKLDMYKRIAAIRNEADAGDMRDEMKDRFGGIPIEAERLIQIAELKAVASSEYITKVSGRDGNLNLTMDRNAPVDVDRIPYLLNDYGGDLRLKTVGDPVFTLLYEGSGPELMLEKTKELLEHMKMIIMVK